MSECAHCMGERRVVRSVFLVWGGIAPNGKPQIGLVFDCIAGAYWFFLLSFFLLLHMVFQLSIYLRQPIKYVLWFLCFSYVFGFSIRVDLSKLTHLFFMGPIVVNGVGVNFCWGESFKKCKWVFFFLINLNDIRVIVNVCFRFRITRQLKLLTNHIKKTVGIWSQAKNIIKIIERILYD